MPRPVAQPSSISIAKVEKIFFILIVYTTLADNTVIAKLTSTRYFFRIRQMKRLNYIIALDGIKIILVFLSLSITSFIFLPTFVGFVFLVLFLWSLWFFRNPKRYNNTAGEKEILSPADGQIVAVGPAHESVFFNKEMKKVSIFMNVFNVHVNRSPISASVKNVKYFPGKFLIASHPRASSENERNALELEASDFKLCLVQIAGKVARRIVSYAQPGVLLERGQAFGLIQFGSRVDVYLPLDVAITVKAGDHVKAGVTVLAEKK